MVYRLDAVDAYQRELVKQIEVAALEVDGDHNRPYVKLISTQNKRGSIAAKIEADIISGSGHGFNDGFSRSKTATISNRRLSATFYENFRIGTITVGQGQSVNGAEHALRGETLLHPGDYIGGVNSDDLKRLMIRRTIKEHLDKEMRFAVQKRMVKVLSLLFVDSVSVLPSVQRERETSLRVSMPLCFEDEFREFCQES